MPNSLFQPSVFSGDSSNPMAKRINVGTFDNPQPDNNAPDPYLTAETQLSLERAPWQLRKHIPVGQVQAYSSDLPNGETALANGINPIAGVKRGDQGKINIYNQDRYNDAPDQFVTHEATHLLQNRMAANSPQLAKMPAVDPSNPYKELRLTADDLRNLRSQGDTLWNHSEEGGPTILQKYEARQEWLRNKATPQERQDYMNSTGQFKGKGNSEWQQTYEPYLDDLDDIKLPGDMKMAKTPVKGPSLLGQNYATPTVDGHPNRDGMEATPDFIPVTASADDTPDFIPVEQSANPSPVAKMSAAKPQPWLTQVDEDLRQGGNRTFIGRTLGHMQGNGDKGYSGLNSGVSPETADFMGSVPLGAVKMAKGAVENATGHPWEGAKDVVGGGMQAATIPSAFMGGPAIEGAADALPELIPTRAGAGKLFGSVMDAAKDEPVSFTRSMPHLERTQQLASAGASPLRPADLLYNRVNTVNPVPYGEARDFASNLSRMSAAEKMSTNPQMAREAKLLSHALNGDIGEAADNAGVGNEYRNAMSQYRRAARNTEMAKTAGKAALKYVIPSGVGYEAYKHLTK